MDETSFSYSFRTDPGVAEALAPLAGFTSDLPRIVDCLHTAMNAERIPQGYAGLIDEQSGLGEVRGVELWIDDDSSFALIVAPKGGFEVADLAECDPGQVARIVGVLAEYLGTTTT